MRRLRLTLAPPTHRRGGLTARRGRFGYRARATRGRWSGAEGCARIVSRAPGPYLVRVLRLLEGLTVPHSRLRRGRSTNRESQGRARWFRRVGPSPDVRDWWPHERASRRALADRR